MRNTKPYDRYKDSGFDWLGDIPEHWNAKRAKWVFKEVDFRSETGMEELLSVSEHFGVIPRKNANVTMFKAESYVGYKLCQKGDLVINSLWAWSNGLGVSEYNGIVSTAYGVYRPNQQNENNPRYLHYLMRTKLYVGQYFIRSKGIWISRLQLSDTNFFNIPVLLPSSSEQQAIAAFLDYKLGKIDRFIVKKKKLIKLLNEQKAAIINQAVTKGLDANAKMKPSGIDWLGDIPEHWEVKKLKFVCSLIKDGTHLPPPRVQDGFPLLSVRNLVNGNYIRFLDDDSKISEQDFAQLEKSFVVKENDILLAIVGATMGKVSLVPKMSKFTIQRSVGIFRPIKEIMHFKFLFYFFSNNSFQSILWNNTGFSAQPGIYLGALANFSTTSPPVEEQLKIVEFIEKETATINLTISKIEKEIALVQEYRTTLIAEAVTGKIDVRGYEIPTIDEDEEILDEPESDIETEEETIEEDTE